MPRLNEFATIAFVICLTCIPVRAYAQDQPVGKLVHVRVLDGSKRSGSLISLDSKSVVIEQRGGALTVPLAEVRTITRASYALPAGTAIGLGAGFVGGLVVCGNESDCHPLQGALLYGAVGAGIGAAAGGVIKAIRSNSRVVYRAPAKTSIAVAPVFSRRSVGVRGVVSW